MTRLTLEKLFKLVRTCSLLNTYNKRTFEQIDKHSNKTVTFEKNKRGSHHVRGKATFFQTKGVISLSDKRKQRIITKVIYVIDKEHSNNLLNGETALDMGRTYSRPTTLGPWPWPRAPFTFLRPPVQITFSRPVTMELLFHDPPFLPASKITFSRALVTTTVFFYSFKQNST